MTFLNLDSTSTYVGVSYAIFGNLLISISLNIQKYVHNKISIEDEYQPLIENASRAEFKNFLTKPLWWCGFCFMIAGELGNFIAYGYCQASIIAPLGTTALICNAVIAPFALQEKFRRRDLFGIFLAILGSVCIVSFAKSDDRIVIVVCLYLDYPRRSHIIVISNRS